MRIFSISVAFILVSLSAYGQAVPGAGAYVPGAASSPIPPGTVLSNCTIGSAAPSANTYICIALVPSTATYTVSGTGACLTQSAKAGGAVTGPGLAAGKLTATGTSGSCVITLTLPTVNNDWTCGGSDVTQGISLVQLSPISATACVLSGAATNGDVITFWAVGF